MPININYPKGTYKNSNKNLVLFTNGKFKITKSKKFLTNTEFSYVSDLLKTHDPKKNLLIFEVSSKKKIALILIKDNLKISDIENLGADLFKKLNHGKNSEYDLISDSINSKSENFLGYFLHGLKLKSYEFKKYKTKKDTRLISINIVGKKNKPSIQSQLKFKALEEGTFYARDLVSEPGNVLHPDEYAKG